MFPRMPIVLPYTGATIAQGSLITKHPQKVTPLQRSHWSDLTDNQSGGGV